MCGSPCCRVFTVSKECINISPVVPPNPEDLKHGAVLCAWGFYLAVQEAAETCHSGEDLALQAELVRSIRRMETFIKVNGHVDDAYIEAWEKRVRDQTKDAQACKDANTEELYQHIKAIGPDALRRGIDQMLAVPRTPVINPCF